MFDSLTGNTDLSPVTDIRGMTEEEVYAKEDEYRKLTEQKPEEGSVIQEGIGHLRFNTAVGAWGEHLYKLYNYEPDPDFNVTDALTLKETPLETFEPYEQKLLSYASNSEHMQDILEQIEDKREWKQNTEALGGVKSFVTDMAAEVLNPLNWVNPMAAAKYYTGVKKLAVAGLGTAAMSGAEEAAISKIYEDKTLTDVVAGTVLGGIVGAGVGSFIKPSALSKAQETVAKDIKKSAEKLIQESVQERVQIPKESVGAMKLDPYQELTGKVHAQFRGAPDDPTVMQAFNKLVDEKLPKQKGYLRPEETVGIGESFQRSDNPLERYLGSLIVEHSEGTGGKVTAEHSADLLADVYFQMNRGSYVQAYNKHAKLFKTERKKNKLNLGSFDDEVYKEVDKLDLGRDDALTKIPFKEREPWQQAIISHAAEIREQNKRLYNFCKEKGVTEFQGKDVNDLYLMRPYDAKKFVRMANLHGKDKVISLIHKAINTGNEFSKRLASALKRNLKEGADALPEEEIEKEVLRITRRMAEAVFNRMSNRTIHTGADANVLKTANQKLLLDAMQDIGISKTDIDHVKYVLDTAGRDRFSDPNKGRISMNMSATEWDLSMTDLLSTDLAGGFLGEIRRWSARAALAEKGFPDRGVYDNALLSMTEVGKSMDDSSKGLKRTQKAYDRLSAAWDLIQGRPIEKDVDSSLKKSLRALRKLAAAAKLGKIVTAQTTETGRMVASVGVLRTLKELPSIRNMIRNAKTGRLSDALLEDLELAGHGRIGDELSLRHPDFRIEETYEGAFPGEKTLDTINYGLAKYTGFEGVQKIQKRFFARTYAMRLWKEITSDTLDTALANDLGIDKRMQNLFKSEMEKYAETVKGFGKREVANLNVRKWSPEAREAFITVLHKQSSNAIQKIYVGDLPLWTSKSFGQFLIQFRSFGLSSAGKHGVHDYRMLKSGNIEGINAFLFTAAMSTALYIAKTEIDSFGLSPSKRKKYLKNRLNEKAIAKNSVNWMGQLGLATDVSSMLLSGLAPDVLGDNVSYARTGDIGEVFTAVPGIGYVGGAAKGVSGATKAMTSDYEFSKSDFKALWGSVPFNNIYGVTNLRNLIENKYFK